MLKFVVITGSSGGIGSALVKTFINDGYNVVGIDKCKSELSSDLYREVIADLNKLAQEENYRIKVLQQIKALLPEEKYEFILINNAAIQLLNKLENLNTEDWYRSLSINLVAPFFLVHGLLEQLTEMNGCVINISSIHARLTKSDFSCYAASKAALESLTRSLAIELSGRGVSVNAISPAAISTEMLKEGFAKTPHKLEELESFHPSGSIGTPEQLATFVKSISEQRGGFLTGSVLEFNGAIGGKLHDPN